MAADLVADPLGWGHRAGRTVVVSTVRQRWAIASFLHWRYEPAVVERLLPPGVAVDVADGSAWVSIVAFRVDEATPRLRSFAETNVRTYVRGPAGRSAIWFLSLDAGSRLTAFGGSTFYGVPYHLADATAVEQPDGDRRYVLRRRPPGPRPAHDLTIRAVAGHEPLADLDIWLTGRWRAISGLGGRLLETFDDHQPGVLRPGEVVSASESLLAAAGLAAPECDPLVHVATGTVDARLGLPRPLPRT